MTKIPIDRFYRGKVVNLLRGKMGHPVALFDLARDGMGIPLGAFSPIYLGKAPFPFLFAPLSTSAFPDDFSGKMKKTPMDCFYREMVVHSLRRFLKTPQSALKFASTL
jgi:hypothetical protein